MSASGTRQAWLAQPERGSAAMIRALVWLALRAGRRATRCLLYPVCLYFLFFSPRARRASRQYLARVLGRRPGFADLFRHYFSFAAVALDRVFFLNEQSAPFDIRVYGEEHVMQLAAQGRGCFLLGAHLGSFEVLRVRGRHARLPVSIVMYEDNAQKMNAALHALNPTLAAGIIALGRPDSMLRVEASLERGECVGMLADRALENDGGLRCDFLGAPALFPLGPLRLAALLRRPVLLMVGLYRGGARYDIHFEPLIDLSDAPRGERGALIEQGVRRYVARLEHYCRSAPYNWFNFYEFWK